jgi:hypothetical protein
MPDKTVTDIINRMHSLSKEIQSLAFDLDYYGGLNWEWVEKSTELLGASFILESWADSIKGDYERTRKRLHPN